MASEAGACPEKYRLLLEYERSSNEFARTVMVLRTRLGVLTKEEYERFRAKSEKLRREVDSAQKELEAHTAEHGC